MKLTGTWFLAAVIGCAPGTASAQWQSLPAEEPQQVFAGAARKISALWHNAGNEPLSAEMRFRLYQISAATAAPFAERPWKTVELLSGQTVVERVAVDFPEVNGRTAFLIQWLAGTHRIIGNTQVLVYPTNLLNEMKPLFHGANLGVLDLNGALKPALAQNGVPFLDLGQKTVEDFSGKLAVIGPFRSKTQMRHGLAQAIQQIAKKNTPVVWIQPPMEPGDELQPSFYVVPEGRGAVVVAQSDLLADFSDNPKSQLNLIHLCKLALNPVPLPLPDLNSQR